MLTQIPTVLALVKLDWLRGSCFHVKPAQILEGGFLLKAFSVLQSMWAKIYNFQMGKKKLFCSQHDFLLFGDIIHAPVPLTTHHISPVNAVSIAPIVKLDLN